MIIELVGLPGSGKSTFARHLCANGDYERIKITSRRELVWFNILFLLRHPVLNIRLLILLWRYRGPQKLWKLKFASVFLDYNAKYIKANRKKNSVLDQGHLQILLSLFEKPLSETEVHRIFTMLPKPDHYVFFDTPQTVRSNRIGERDYNSRHMFSTEEFESWESTNAIHFTHLIKISTTSLYSTFVTDGEDTAAVCEYFLKQPALYYLVGGRMPTEKAYGNQIVEMAQAFSAAGVRVEVWHPRRKNPITTSVFDYYHAPHTFAVSTLPSFEWTWRRNLFPRIGFYTEQLLFLYRLSFARIPADAIVYTRRPELAWLFSLRGRTVVFESHEWIERFLWLQRQMITRVKLIVTTNKFLKDKFVAHGITSKRILVAPNGVRYEDFASEFTHDEARAKLSLRFNIASFKQARVLLYTGNFKTMEVDKGISDCLKALALLSPEYHFVAVGGTEAHISEYTAEAKALGVLDRAHFFGRVNRSDLVLFGRAADVLLMPFPKKAHYEYFMSPLKIFEYMALGRPIVTSDLPSIKEVLNEETAFFAPPDKPKMLANCIKETYKNYDVSEQKAAYARKMVAQYTWENRVEKISKKLFL